MIKGSIKLAKTGDTAKVAVSFEDVQREEWAGQIDPETGTIYGREELKAALDLVADQSNWKMPLPGYAVPLAKVTVVVEAVRFYLGGLPTVDLRSDGLVRVTGAGYYGWIGA